MKTAEFDFTLPEAFIARHPMTPRDAARLLVVRENAFDNKIIRDLPELLNENDVMVFNDTRVLPARLWGMRGEARVQVTLHRSQNAGATLWSAFAKPGKRLRAQDTILFSDSLRANVIQKHENGEITLLFSGENIFQALQKYGEMPLPPYMKRAVEATDATTYQTVYAAHDGAVAAPTAGLHFTQSLLDSLTRSGIERHFVTLHVGAGTFQPVTAETTDAHVMHKEFAELTVATADALNAARAAGKRIVAVGTTALRTLESAADAHGRLQPMRADTALFITPGYRFKVVDALLTNFHLPRSTLFMLVSAFSGLQRMKNAYRHAIEQKYRFYSYGDACFLTRLST